MLGKNLF